MTTLSAPPSAPPRPPCPGVDRDGGPCGHVRENLDGAGAVHLSQMVARFLGQPSPVHGDCLGVALLLAIRQGHPSMSLLHIHRPAFGRRP